MNLPNHSALALYLYWRAARKGKTQVVISNKALRVRFKKYKVHSTRIEKFAQKLKPVFPHFFIKKSGIGPLNDLVLCFNKSDGPSTKAERLRFDSIPDQAVINKSLGIVPKSV